MATQEDAVKHGNGHALLLAGPGTGKTTAILKRIEYLIRDLGVAAERSSPSRSHRQLDRCG